MLVSGLYQMFVAIGCLDNWCVGVAASFWNEMLSRPSQDVQMRSFCEYFPAARPIALKIWTSPLFDYRHLTCSQESELGQISGATPPPLRFSVPSVINQCGAKTLTCRSAYRKINTPCSCTRANKGYRISLRFEVKAG